MYVSLNLDVQEIEGPKFQAVIPFLRNIKYPKHMVDVKSFVLGHFQLKHLRVSVCWGTAYIEVILERMPNQKRVFQVKSNVACTGMSEGATALVEHSQRLTSFQIRGAYSRNLDAVISDAFLMDKAIVDNVAVVIY